MSRTVLIPAAGAGSRFSREGIATPKPLIQVNGETLLERTIACFNSAPGDRLLLAVQRQHRVREQLDARLQKRFPQQTLHWLELDGLLPGQLATATAATEHLLERVPDCADDQLLIHNCDTGFAWTEALAHIPGFAAMAVFEAEGDHWSFGLPDPSDPERAVAIAEKQRISNLASIGLYGFATAAGFLHQARQQLQQGETVRGEHYIAPMLQQAITAGKTISLPRVNGVQLYGTPSELCRTFGISLENLQQQNPTDH